MLVHIGPRLGAVVIVHIALELIGIVLVQLPELKHLGLVGNVFRSLDHGEQTVPVLAAVDHVDLIGGDTRLADQKIGQRPGAGPG